MLPTEPGSSQWGGLPAESGSSHWAEFPRIPSISQHAGFLQTSISQARPVPSRIFTLDDVLPDEELALVLSPIPPPPVADPSRKIAPLPRRLGAPLGDKDLPHPSAASPTEQDGVQGLKSLLQYSSVQLQKLYTKRRIVNAAARENGMDVDSDSEEEPIPPSA